MSPMAELYCRAHFNNAKAVQVGTHFNSREFTFDLCHTSDVTPVYSPVNAFVVARVTAPAKTNALP